MKKKSIKKNYIYNLLYQALSVILPLFTTPYLSRVLGVKGIGIYSYTVSIVTYFVLLGSLGISLYGQREVAYLQDDKEKLSKLFWELVILRLFTMIISTIIYYFFVVKSNSYSLYYKILLLELLSYCFDISWFYQGLENFKKVIIRNFAIRLSAFVSIFLFVKTKSDVNIYVLIYALSSLFGNIALWIDIKKYINLPKNIKPFNHLKNMFLLFVPQVAIQVYTVLDKTMLGKLLDDMNEVGNYEQSQKIINLALTILTSLGTVVAPRIANTFANNNKKKVEEYLENLFRFIWLAGFPITMGLIAVVKNFVPWFFGSEFNDSIRLIMIGAPLVIAIGLNNATGVQYLINVNKHNKFTISVVIGAIVNFMLNLIFIPKYGAIGAIITSLTAETIILIVQLIFIRKDFDLKIIYKNSLNYIISGIIMFIIVYFLGTKLEANIVSTFIQVFLGIIIYVIILIILKDKFLINVLTKILGKFNIKIGGLYEKIKAISKKNDRE